MWMVYLWNKKEGCMEMGHGKHLRSCRIWSKEWCDSYAGTNRNRFQLVESCEDAINMMEDIGMENVKLMFDTTHALYRNEVPSDYVYLMNENLKHIHMADYNRKAPGTNGCDFVEIMQALKDINYDGYITMENGFESRSSHPFVVARQSLENLKAIENSLK